MFEGVSVVYLVSNTTGWLPQELIRHKAHIFLQHLKIQEAFKGFFHLWNFFMIIYFVYFSQIKYSVSVSTTVLFQVTEHTKLQRHYSSVDALKSAFGWYHFSITVRTPAATPVQKLRAFRQYVQRNFGKISRSGQNLVFPDHNSPVILPSTPHLQSRLPPSPPKTHKTQDQKYLQIKTRSSSR